MTMSAYGESDSERGTWEVSGSKVTMTIDDEPLTTTYKISGSTLTLTIVDTGEDDGETMVFTRQ